MAASEPAETEEVTESDDEGTDGYRKGGYHVVTVGEVYNGRYCVLAKLGWGHFSTVWLCQDGQSEHFVAMKVQKSAPNYQEAAYDEIELLSEAANPAGGGRQEWEKAQSQGYLADILPRCPFTGVVTLVDQFEHNGPNGKHVCMVFETMGPNVLALIKRYDFKGIPLDITRKVAAHTLIGLDYLHRICGIIHTDLKPENVLVGCPHSVPVNKHGIPLIGNIDPTAVAAKRDSMLRRLMVSKESQKNGDAKSGGKEGGKGERNRVGPRQQKPQLPPCPQSILAASGCAEAADLSAEGAKQMPPYMRPLLKPSSSDPTLLSSYGDSAALLQIGRAHV